MFAIRIVVYYITWKVELKRKLQKNNRASLTEQNYLAFLLVSLYNDFYFLYNLCTWYANESCSLLFPSFTRTAWHAEFYCVLKSELLVLKIIDINIYV